MPSVKELARVVIAQEWRLPNDAFETLWSRLAVLPRRTTPLSTSVPGQHPLAGTGVHVEQVAIAVFLFTQVADDFPDGAERESVMTKIEELGDLLGQRGVARRIRKALESATVGVAAALADTRTQRPFARAYTHDEPNSRDLTKDDAIALNSQRTAFVIFIYQPRGLRDRSIGRVYFHLQPLPIGQSHPQAIPPLQYRLLVYLLQHRHDDQRARADFVERCWGEKGKADKFRKQPKLLQDEIRTYDIGFHRLSKILHDQLIIEVKSHGTGIWELVPWPTTYCVIEEQ